ncbi:MAG: hypothetical protein K2K57_08620, partial [Oscillospiraceae bacterium]|nr:hypothetical protein [Oscillospiraceae bacterium]
MDEDRNRSSGNSSAEFGSSEPDISDVIRVLRAAAGIGDNGQPTGQSARQIPDKPTAENDTALPKDRVEFSPEALKKLSERPTAKAAEKARNSQSAANPNEALNALKIFREMSGVTGAEAPQTPDKTEIGASQSNAVKSPEKPSEK